MINTELFQELKERFELDQKLNNEKNVKKFDENCVNNTLWMKEKISQHGWLNSDIVGEQGELYAWLIAQHSEDIDFQKKCLELLKKTPITSERKGHIAYLTDRILIREGKKQLYGTQFSNGQPYPIEDVKELDVRRREMSLEKFEDYCKRMNKMISGE